MNIPHWTVKTASPKPIYRTIGNLAKLGTGEVLLSAHQLVIQRQIALRILCKNHYMDQQLTFKKERETV